jgi:hypothetical protein
MADGSRTDAVKTAAGIVALAALGVLGIALFRGATAGPPHETRTSSAAVGAPAASPAASGWRTAPDEPPTADTATASGAGSAAPTPGRAGKDLTTLERDVFARLGDPHLGRTDLLDLLPDQPYRVRVLGSVADRQFGAVLIDFERDGVWDERWTVKDGVVLRKSPFEPGADDDTRR